MSKTRLAPALFLNRELGQLAFNRRVLAQAENPATPLLERLRFLCIVSSNLDEFFEIRVAGLHAEIEAGITVYGPDGMPTRRGLNPIAETLFDPGRELARLIAGERDRKSVV